MPYRGRCESVTCKGGRRGAGSGRMDHGQIKAPVLFSTDIAGNPGSLESGDINEAVARPVLARSVHIQKVSDLNKARELWPAEAKVHDLHRLPAGTLHEVVNGTREQQMSCAFILVG